MPPDRYALKLLPISLDGEMHRLFRRLIEPAFSPTAVQGYAAKARQLAIDLIEGFYADGRCEFVVDFALVMPLSVFLWLADLPLEDRPLLQRWVHASTRGTLEEGRAALGHMVAYVEVHLRARRAHPGDDLLSRVILAKVDGRPLTHEEVLGTSLLLMFAGLDTVAAMMAFVMHHLARRPETRRWIIDNPTQISIAAEELMRRHGVANNVRTATTDVNLDGVTIHQGEHVLLPNCIHGLDERLFPNAASVDFSRKPGQTATFGFGPHRCAGMNLARMEMRILLQEWLSRIPDFEVDPALPVVQQTSQVNGLLQLPLRWPVMLSRAGQSTRSET